MSGLPARADSGGKRRRAGTSQRAGLLGAVLAAAGVVGGIAAERALIRRSRRREPDPYAAVKFGQQPYDEALTVTAPDGTDLYVEIVEPVDGVELDLGFDPGRPEPVLVFVHGFCLDMGTFYFQRAELARRGEYRMVFYDQPGHGRSGRLESGEYELPALGEALRAVLDATVPKGPVVLIGHSMGGMTIMAFAEQYPEMFGDRVVGVVLMATSGGRPEQVKFGLPAMVGKLGQPLLPLLNGVTRVTGGVVDRARLASSDLAWLLTRRYGFGSPRPSPTLVSFVEQMNSHTSTETIARYLRTLYTHARYPALVALRHTPVLVVCGDHDMITPLEHSEEICRHLPDAELVVVPGSGHVVMLEHAEEVNAALFRFLEKIE
ncbi:MAG: alpha/beta hydrolase [Micromonosporaceae bacterium]|nr:alpha/beta hydrolase [Micromonosporaceae bacterium]